MYKKDYRHTYVQGAEWIKVMDCVEIDVDDYGMLFLTKQDLLYMLDSFQPDWFNDEDEL